MTTVTRYRSLGWVAVAVIGAVNPLAAQQAPKEPRGLLPGTQTGPAPWPAEMSKLSERLKAIGLPAMPNEAFAVHIHQSLTISVLGTPVKVPAGIGINRLAGYISPVHTHDSTGTIHIESAKVQPFTLGQFFDVWGVRLTSQCVGGYCSRGIDSLRVSANGVLLKGNPRNLILDDHQVIEVRFGPARNGPPLRR
jgi:hypothetical protein